jgi:hypothetical protein
MTASSQKRLIELAEMGLLNAIAEASRRLDWATTKKLYAEDIDLVKNAKKELETP